ncbi:MAG TPA: rhomboid family intramembrane serine protease [Vulgatibacter sp.]|nr:rhomboid family intramembrane serine protease [Vulgatibacter sp.]
MFPLKDDIPVRRLPIVTIALIAASVGVFAWQVGWSGSFVGSVWSLGLVPANLLATSSPGDTPPVETLFTSMFAHGSLLHLGSNMLFLWIFGNNVEDAMGRWRFVLFYLLCGLGAAAAQIASDPTSTLPMVGASGAIGGVLGAYFLLYPRARVLALVPIFIFVRLVWIPAVVFLGLWFLFQIVGGLGSVGASGGVAFWAHVGGFVAGVFLVKPFVGDDWPSGRRAAWM